MLKPKGLASADNYAVTDQEVETSRLDKERTKARLEKEIV